MARPSGPNGPRRGRQCEACGAHYNATYSAQRTCGRACGLVLKGPDACRPRPRWPSCRIHVGRCLNCDALFSGPRSGSHAACSPACVIAVNRARAQEYAAARKASRKPRPTPRPQPCVTCGGGDLHYPPRKCGPCVTQAKREEKRTRAARKRGVATERYTLAEIAARDRQRCGLCGGPVSMAKAVPHPNAPTVDHVVPIARGGDDTRANVQLAHFLCNSTKGDRGQQQLALIG